MAEAGTAYIEFRGDYSKIDREARSAGTRAGSDFGTGFGRSLSSGLSGAGRAIAGFAKTGALVLGGLGVAGGAWGLSVAAQAEQAEIAFTTMLGSGEKAKAFLDELKAFAAQTPFEFPELQTAASSLISAGFAAEDVIPIMTTLGDVTSGMGTGAEGVQRATVALQQMAAAGRITGEDLNQLRDAGIPVFDLLASATGKSKEEIANLAQAGKLGRTEMEQLFEALRTGGGGLERFSGLMEAQSQSLAGLFSTLKDTLGQGLAEALGPVIPLLKDMIPTITETASALTGLFGGAISTLAPAILPLLERLADVVTNVLGAGFEALAPALDPLIDLLGEVAGILGDSLLDAFDALAPLFPVIADAIGQMAPLVRELASTLGTVLVDALNELVPAMIENAPTFIELAEAMLELTIAILPLVGPLASLVALFSKFPVAIANQAAMAIGLWASAIGALTSFDFAGAFGTIQRFFAGLPALVGNALGMVRTAVAAFVTQTLPAFVRSGVTFVTGLVRGLVSRLPYLLGFLAGLVASMPGRLLGLVLAARAKGTEMIAALLRSIVAKVPEVLAFLRGLPGRAVEALAALVPRLLDAGFKAINALLRGLISGVPALLGFIRGLPGRMLDTFGDITGRLFDIGVDIIRGLINGIKSMAGEVSGVVGGIVDGITDGFTGALGIGSPSKVFEGYGVNIAEGLNRGLAKSSSLVTAGVDSLVGATDLEPSSVFAGGGGLTVVQNIDGREVSRTVYPHIVAIQRDQVRSRGAA
jgi:tape measure domain-containing protein